MVIMDSGFCVLRVGARGVQRTRARPHPPDEETWNRFLRTLRRKRRARIAIEITLESPVQGSNPSLVIGSEVPEPVEAVRMTGWFVAIER